MKPTAGQINNTWYTIYEDYRYDGKLIVRILFGTYSQETPNAILINDHVLCWVSFY